MLLAIIYRIHHIEDDTLIKRECAVIVAIWVSLALFTLIAFSCQQSVKCDQEPKKVNLVNNCRCQLAAPARDLSMQAVML